MVKDCKAQVKTTEEVPATLKPSRERLVWAATHMRSVMESGGVFPVPAAKWVGGLLEAFGFGLRCRFRVLGLQAFRKQWKNENGFGMNGHVQEDVKAM